MTALGMLQSQARAAVPTARQHSRHVPSVQQQMQAQARTRFSGSSKLYLAGGNRLQTAMQQATQRSSKQQVAARCAGSLRCSGRVQSRTFENGRDQPVLDVACCCLLLPTAVGLLPRVKFATACCRCRAPARMCGIIGVFKHEGEANVEIYEGLLMLQHRGQDSGALHALRFAAFGCGGHGSLLSRL